MNTNGWYLTVVIAQEGTEGAGKPCWAAMLNGEIQQGFPFSVQGLVDGLEWGPLNPPGEILPVRIGRLSAKQLLEMLHGSL